MQKIDDRYRFIIEDIIKTTRPGKNQPVLILPKYDDNIHRCVFRTLEQYITDTKDLRGEISKLFISIIKPHKTVNKGSISRWIKATLTLAGIDTFKFKPHSTRAASTSSADRATVPITSIMKAASWEIAETFATFYNKPLQSESDFAKAVLDHKC